MQLEYDTQNVSDDEGSASQASSFSDERDYNIIMSTIISFYLLKYYK